MRTPNDKRNPETRRDAATAGAAELIVADSQAVPAGLLTTRSWDEANARVCDGVGDALDLFIRNWSPRGCDNPEDEEVWRIQLQAALEEEIEIGIMLWREGSK